MNEMNLHKEYNHSHSPNIIKVRNFLKQKTSSKINVALTLRSSWLKALRRLRRNIMHKLITLFELFCKQIYITNKLTLRNTINTNKQIWNYDDISHQPYCHTGCLCCHIEFYLRLFEKVFPLKNTTLVKYEKEERILRWKITNQKNGEEKNFKEKNGKEKTKKWKQSTMNKQSAWIVFQLFGSNII